MKISAFSIAVFKSPLTLLGLVVLAISLLASSSFSSSGSIIPRLFKIKLFLAPANVNKLEIAIPAAPAPLITILTSEMSFLTILNALITADNTITAVPCWSSWNTGISNSSINLFSISKHLGAAISSRLIPPNEGEIAFTVLIISSVSCVFKQIGNASTLPNSLNKTDLPSITGIPAIPPIFPKPKTAEPSVTTATMFPLFVYLYAKSLSS